MKSMTTLKQSKKSPAWALAALGLLTALVGNGCGKDEFVDQRYSESLAAVGYQTVPAKLDLMLVVDNTPSFGFPYAEFQNSLPSLVSQLASQGWDYHITAIAMAPGNTSTYTYQAISRVLVDPNKNYQYDPNSGAPNYGYVSTDYAVTHPSHLNVVFPINYNIGSSEQTLRGIRDSLSTDRAGFVRDDAQLAVVVISNGDDASGSSTSYWASAIASAARKSNARQIQFFPVVSNYYVGDRSCWGANANVGRRYLEIANLFNTLAPTAYDVCRNSSMSQIVNVLVSQLRATKNAYVRTAIVFSRRPTTLSITKNGVVIPQDPTNTNGWNWDTTLPDSYTASPIPTVTEPYNLNYEGPGWVIRLYGNGRAVGTDNLQINATY
jgi:hypothetical protein